MACVYIPDRLLGFIKILLIWFFFSCVLSLVILVVSRQIIIDRWDDYKCNPLITPFASAFGHDAQTTMHQCSSQIFHMQATPMIGSLTDVFGDLAGIGDALMNGLSNAMDALGAGNQFTEGVFKNFISQLENVGSVFHGLVIHLQMLFSQLAASLLTIVNTLESIFYMLTGIRPTMEFAAGLF